MNAMLSELFVYSMMFAVVMISIVLFYGGASLFSLNGGEMALILFASAAIVRMLMHKWWPLADGHRSHLVRMASTSGVIFLVLQFLK